VSRRSLSWPTSILLLAAVTGSALARPTHGEIHPLPTCGEVNGLDVFPLEVGSTWAYRDSTDRESRNVIAASATALARNGKTTWKTWKRDSYDLSEPGHAKLVEHWMFAVDEQRGVLSLGGVETDDVRGPAIGLAGGLSHVDEIRCAVCGRAFGRSDQGSSVRRSIFSRRPAD